MKSTKLGTESLWVVFERRGDRFHHEIYCRAAGGMGRVLVSREGNPDDAWPPSPPLQSLHLETRPGKDQTAMLVGMAGKSHWSMSVEFDASQCRLLFDVACRLNQPAEWLGSTYDSNDEHGGAWALDYLTISAWTVSKDDEEAAMSVDRVTGCWRIAALSPHLAGPQTVRWRYAICLQA